MVVTRIDPAAWPWAKTAESPGSSRAPSKVAAAACRTSNYTGTKYYFCSDDCKKPFDKEPARYAGR
jgi:YHS domain-containing protein